MSGCPGYPGAPRCPRWRCDCFIEEYPGDPMGLHPEAFVVTTTPPPLCGGDHDEAGIEDCDACQAEVLEPGCSPGCRACRDDGREYRWEAL